MLLLKFIAHMNFEYFAFLLLSLYIIFFIFASLDFATLIRKCPTFSN